MRKICLIALLFLGCGDAPRTSIPSLRLPHLSSPPTIDGHVHEAAWRRAATTERFVNTMTGASASPEVTAQLAWDDGHLYVAFAVADDHLLCTFEGHDAHLWEQDAVELMIDPDGDGQNYFELQLSPTEKVFDTRFDRRRQPAPIGHVSWNSDLEGAVVANGRPNDGAEDGGYHAELAIPFAALERGHPSGAAPRRGDTWRLALYVLDARPDGQRGVAWSAPMIGDYHVPERFGRITFAD